MKEIPLIVACVNRFDLFTKLILSVDTPIRPIVIDCWRENLGVAGAWNEGMIRAIELGYRYAVITGDDVSFEPGTLRTLYDTLIETGAAMVSPNECGWSSTSGIYEGSHFFCYAIDIKQVLDKAGFFDENFFPGYGEETDMSWRMRKAGLKTLINADIIANHEVSASRAGDPELITDAMIEKNHQYFVSKWTNDTADLPFEGFPIWYWPNHEHLDIWYEGVTWSD
jgi:GT2 family glycosyltransferase